MPLLVLCIITLFFVLLITIYFFMFFKYFPNCISIINKILIFFSLYPPTPVSTFPPAILPLSSGPWVTCVSSLASPFRILFLTSPCLFCSCQLCFLSPAPFSPLSPSPLPADNPLNDPHTYDYVPVLVGCLVFVFVVFKFIC